MRAVAVPAVAPIDDDATLADPVRANAGRTPDAVQVHRRTPDGWEPDGWEPDGWEPDGWEDVTCARFRDDVTAVANGRVTAGGKNVAPAVLEDRLQGHPLISQSMVVGDGRPFIAALVTIDPQAFTARLVSNGKPASATVETLQSDPELRGEVRKAVDAANLAVSRAEAIKEFRILPREFTEEAGEVTPSLKIKRNVVLKDHADEIAAIYGG